jgi:hypothetical protein
MTGMTTTPNQEKVLQEYRQALSSHHTSHTNNTRISNSRIFLIWCNENHKHVDATESEVGNQ